MDMREPGREPGPEAARAFATTHWSVVVAAGLDESSPARSALDKLCRAYWYPIYVYVRRKGHGPDDAQDLTQEFFAQLISKHHLRLADRNKGKFRTFLLTGLDYFLAREWSRAHRQKRGGQFSFISLDQQTPRGWPFFGCASATANCCALNWRRRWAEPRKWTKKCASCSKR